MRMSYWSSDVCSSDLLCAYEADEIDGGRPAGVNRRTMLIGRVRLVDDLEPDPLHLAQQFGPRRHPGAGGFRLHPPAVTLAVADRPIGHAIAAHDHPAAR